MPNFPGWGQFPERFSSSEGTAFSRESSGRKLKFGCEADSSRPFVGCSALEITPQNKITGLNGAHITNRNLIAVAVHGPVHEALIGRSAGATGAGGVHPGPKRWDVELPMELWVDFLN